MRKAAKGVLDPYKPEIHRLLSEDPKLPAVRVGSGSHRLGARRATQSSMTSGEALALFAPPPRTFRGRLTETDHPFGDRRGGRSARPDVVTTVEDGLAKRYRHDGLRRAGRIRHRERVAHLG